MLGPMGHELIPVQGDRAARTFAADHLGTRVVSFDEIDPAVIRGLE